MSPRRIQRKRTKGWRMPRSAVYVGRNGSLNGWGNPFVVEDLLNGGNIDRQQSVDLFRRALIEGRLQFSMSKVRAELAGKNLACWCPLDQPCHADVLLRIAAGKEA
ncbi:DUF4326 domain-containing protein [Zhihengliuella halotolerans]|uniref:DUF4326 domain-containing protein n=1 Tax=Zhihengliuella halotolerans TaxID=370736 RepID=UPI000C80C96A|nr:DUF4326 domain-containing protein [Zhihengliuella halotolerans]